jgi:hypothetical protein
LPPFATTPTIGGSRRGGLAGGRHTGGGGGGNKDRSRGLFALSAKAKFLDAEHVGGRLEGGKWRRVGDDVGGVDKAGVEATQKVQHELCWRDGVPDLSEGIGGALHLLGISVDGEVALGQVVELLFKDDGVRLLVRLEQSLNGDVQSAAS